MAAGRHREQERGAPEARRELRRGQVLAWETERDRQEYERLRELDSPRALAGRVRSGELDLRDLLEQEPDKAGRQELIDGFDGDLRGLKLCGANLQGLDLSRRNFGASDLREARLAGAGLDGANFAFADLRRADMRGCAAREAGFEGAWMDGARVTNADLSGARLDGARLYDTDFSGTRMMRVSMPGAQTNDPASGWGGTRISYDFRRHSGAVYPFDQGTARAGRRSARPQRPPQRAELS